MLVHHVAPDPAAFEEGADDAETAEIAARLALDAYHLVRQELLAYSAEIARKPEIAVVTKLDLIPEKARKPFMKTLKSEGLAAVAISAQTGEGLGELKKRIAAAIKAEAFPKAARARAAAREDG